MVLCAPQTLAYFSGLAESGHERFLGLFVRADGAAALVCPKLTETQARRHGIEDVRAWADGESWTALVEGVCRDWGLGTGTTIAVEDELWAGHLLTLMQALPGRKFVSGGPAVSGLMRAKDAAEIEALRRAGAIVDAVYADVKGRLRVGMTELEVEEMLRSGVHAHGVKSTFCIVATGAGGAEPHHLNDETRLAEGDVLVLDFGCAFEGYQADITRCVAVGEPDPEAFRVYETVYRAHMASFTSARAGATSGAVDEAGRAVIREAGYGEYFTHRTGHGIGLRGHETPNIAPGSDVVLEEGDCFSIEPGIYLPGRFGVRLENIVAIQDGRCVSLNAEISPVLEIVGG